MSHIWTHCLYWWWRRCQDDPNGCPSRGLEETTTASSYHVAEHHPVRSESLQPHTEWSSRPGSEPPSVEADDCVWRYTLLVVHAREQKEEHVCRRSLSEIWYSFYRPTKGRWLSRPMHCGNSVQPVLKAGYHSRCHHRLQWDSVLERCTAVRHATTRPSSHAQGTISPVTMTTTVYTCNRGRVNRDHLTSDNANAVTSHWSPLVLGSRHRWFHSDVVADLDGGQLLNWFNKQTTSSSSITHITHWASAAQRIHV